MFVTSTSENLKKVFEIAQKRLEENNYEKIILIIMDEIGIADESDNNPLKVLHSKLDDNSWIKNEDKNKKIALFGKYC